MEPATCRKVCEIIFSCLCQYLNFIVYFFWHLSFVVCIFFFLLHSLVCCLIVLCQVILCWEDGWQNSETCTEVVPEKKDCCLSDRLDCRHW